jgi:hypothetical protein
MTVKGIDVASYQSTTYATSGYGFVMIKATEGTTYTNPKHDDQVSHGRAAGLLIGHYHFIRPGSVSAQANYFLAHAKAKPGDMLILDWEDTAVSCANKDSFLAYLDAKVATSRNLLYCNKDFWKNRDTTSRCGDGLWIADPDSAPGHPAVQAAWTIHQYAISGGLDQNVANFSTKSAMATWATFSEPAPPVPNNGGTVTTDTTNQEKLAGGLLAIGEVGTVDDSTPSGRQEHAQPYYVAKDYDVQKQILATLVEIRDALTQTPQALTGEQVEHARALTAPAAADGSAEG